MNKKHDSYIKSIENAFTGFLHAIRERNFKLFIVVAVAVLVLMFILNISTIERTLLLFIIIVIFSAELFNSAIEHLADFVTEEHHHQIAKVKEFAAAGVLLLSLASVVIGLWILLPPLIALL